MNWFLALNERAFRAERYADMLKVAVHTALKHTSLVPHMLYDGGESPLTAWLRARGVRIIPCRSFVHERLAILSRERHDPNILAIGAGAFLRVDLPSLAREHGIQDEFVLYTDVDVMFRIEVCASLEALRPRYFAAAPEFDRSNLGCMNSGVMVLNIDRLRTLDGDFKHFITAHLHQLVDQHWDQGAYQRFFGRWSAPAAIGGPRWDALPLEFNWKPYWGRSASASIIHFHGPKPYERGMLRSGTPPDAAKWMIPFTGGAYDEFTCLWNEALSEVTA
jgi:hypothetical protein